MRENAAKGMAEMSETFMAEGGEIYKEEFATATPGEAKDAQQTPPAAE